MTTDTTIFGSEQGDNQGTTPPTKTEDQGLVAALVGEKQKYKSIEDLAKAYANADTFIEQLKEENRKLREQTAQAKTLDEVLERINQTKNQSQDDTPAKAVVDPTTIADLVEKTLTGRENAKIRETNLLQADKLMKEKFGEKAGEVFKAKAATPQLQKVYMELASTDPQQFAALFANEQMPVTAAVDVGSVSGLSLPAATSTRASVEGTKEWAAKVRKENPTQYWSADFQYKLQQSAIKNPKLYFGT